MHFAIDTPPPEWFDRSSPNIDGLIREVRDTRMVAIDTETTGLVVWKDFPKVWSIAFGRRRICMPANTLQWFQESFQDENKQWVFANAKFDMHMLANVGCHLKGQLIDVQVMHAMLYDTLPHGLKEISQHLLDVTWEGFMDTFERRVVPEPFTKNKTRLEGPGEMIERALAHDKERLVNYASMDAWGTLQIFRILVKQLEETYVYSLFPDQYPSMSELFWKIEVPFTRSLFRCERNGILIDESYLQKLVRPMEQTLKEIEKEACHHVGRPINLGSTKELKQYFFEELGLTPLSYTKGGKAQRPQPQVNDEFLAHHSKTHPIARLARDHNELVKFKSTYVVKMMGRLDYGKRLHTRLNQTGARTTRLSSADPNLQN